MTPKNPWTEIPLADYEGHMSLPSVRQAQMLDAVFARDLRAYAPESVAVLGCAGGGGFRHMVSSPVKRVVGVDINPLYLAELRNRLGAAIPGLELVCGDLLDAPVNFPPVQLVHAALVFEYVDPARLLSRIREWLLPDGMLTAVLQLPSEKMAAITPTPFTSLSRLAPFMKLVPPAIFEAHAGNTGLVEESGEVVTPGTGKEFYVGRFRRVGS
jgi:SAM-dependent methyltransferase